MKGKIQNIVSGVILILFAVSFIVVGIVFSKKHEDKLKNCTEQVTAEVIEIKEDTEEELTNDREYELTKERYKKIDVYTPVFEYEYNGKNYKKAGRKSKYSAAFKVGEKVELKIDPSDPYAFYVMDDEPYVYNSISKIIMILSAFFLLFGIYMIKSK